MIGIAVSDVGLDAFGDFLGNLIADIVIAADGGVFNLDVGIERVELGDVSIENGGEIGAHGVVEGDGNFAAVVGRSGFFSHRYACNAQHHGQNQEHGDEFLHCRSPSFLLNRTYIM